MMIGVAALCCISPRNPLEQTCHGQREGDIRQRNNFGSQCHT
jgi:hypothetical protein